MKQLQEIIRKFSDKPDITAENALEELKKNLQESDSATYDKWKDDNFSPDHIFYEKGTLLHASAAEGSVHLAEALLKLKAKVDAVDHEKQTPLHYAARSGEIHVLRLLLKNGADVNARDKIEETPLHKCVQKAPYDEFEDVTLPNGVTESFCMETAVTITLIQGGAEVDAINELQNTPLLLAVRFSNADTVKALVERGASVTAVESYGNNALILAVQEARLDAVPHLLEHGADINVMSKSDNQPPLYYAIQNNHVEMVQYLVGKGAKVKFEDREKTLLDTVPDYTFDDITDCLKEKLK